MIKLNEVEVAILGAPLVHGRERDVGLQDSVESNLRQNVNLPSNRAYLQCSIGDHAARYFLKFILVQQTHWTLLTPIRVKPLSKPISVCRCLVPVYTEGDLVGGFEWYGTHEQTALTRTRTWPRNRPSWTLFSLHPDCSP